MQQKAKELETAGISLIVAVADEDSAEYVYGVLSPAGEPVVALIKPEVFDSYQIAGVPSNLLIAPDGKAAMGQVGWDARVFQPWLDAAKTAMQSK